MGKGIIFSKHNPQWYEVPRVLVQDESLSAPSRAIILLILSLDDNFDMSRDKIHKLFFPDIGRLVFNRSWKELQERGFLIKHHIKGNNGHWDGVQYTVYEYPSNEYASVNDYINLKNKKK